MFHLFTWSWWQLPRALTPGFRTDEVPNTVYFWLTSKVFCGCGESFKVTDPSPFRLESKREESFLEYTTGIEFFSGIYCLTLVPRLEFSGTIAAHCSLDL
ncbi:hypothetical protein AAY473_001901 [Plecturocebus cupreus]